MPEPKEAQKLIYLINLLSSAMADGVLQQRGRKFGFLEEKYGGFTHTKSFLLFIRST